MKNRLGIFLAGFLVTLLVCVGLNVLVAHVNSDCGIQAVLGLAHCSDDISRAGFPLQFMEEGGLAYHSVLDPGAFLIDVGIALLVSMAIGWAAQRYYRRSNDLPI